MWITCPELHLAANSRESNSQPLDHEFDALPLHHQATQNLQIILPRPPHDTPGIQVPVSRKTGLTAARRTDHSPPSWSEMSDKWLCTKIECSYSYIFNVSQGSVATQLRCGGIFNNHSIANSPQSVSGKEFRKSVIVWRRYGQKFGGTFFWLGVVSLIWLDLRPLRFNSWRCLRQLVDVCVGEWSSDVVLPLSRRLFWARIIRRRFLRQTKYDRLCKKSERVWDVVGEPYWSNTGDCDIYFVLHSALLGTEEGQGG